MCAVLAVKNQRWLPKLVSFSRLASDISEAFRPVVPPCVVTTAYGVSWLYLSGCVLHVHNSTFVLTRHKVGYETYKAYRQDPSAKEAAYLSKPSRLALSVTHRAFQFIVWALTHKNNFIMDDIWQGSFRTDHPFHCGLVSTSLGCKSRFKIWGLLFTGLALVPIPSISPSNMPQIAPLAGYEVIWRDATNLQNEMTLTKNKTSNMGLSSIETRFSFLYHSIWTLRFSCLTDGLLLQEP